jgi:predicted transcriptional regulator
MKVYPINAKYRVLIVLLKLGGSGKYSDIDRMMRNSNLRFFIEQLRQEGFIEDRYEGNKHIIKLTEDGEKLAKRLMEAEEFVMMKIAQARGRIQ